MIAATICFNMSEERAMTPVTPRRKNVFPIVKNGRKIVIIALQLQKKLYRYRQKNHQRLNFKTQTFSTIT